MEEKQMEYAYNEEKGISLGDLLFLIKKNILMILIITGLCTLGGAIYGLNFKKINYAATSTIIVRVESSSSSSSSSDYQNYTLSTYLVNTVTSFIESNTVLGNVVDSDECEKYDLSTTSLAKAISIKTSTSSLLVTITYECSDEEQAIDVVNQVVQSTIDISNMKNEDGNYRYDKLLAGNILLLDEAKKEYVTASRGAALVIVICFIVGFIISFSIVLIKYLADDTFTSKDDFERIFKINVLTLLPEIATNEKGKGKK